MHPHLGKIRYDDFSEVVLEDLPGLIEGAHMNKGLGHRFLKHIENAKLLIYVLDGSNDPVWSRNAINDFEILNNELKQYSEILLKKPFIIALNKSDQNPEHYEGNKRQLIKKIEKEKLPTSIIEVSGKDGTNMHLLVLEIKRQIDLLKNERLSNTLKPKH